MKAPITAVIITKNEEDAIERCIEAASFCEQVLVIDSASDDDTARRARDAGAQVVQFSWNGAYPKKKQWGMSRAEVRHNWVLHLDADEVVTPALAEEISSTIIGCDNSEVAAFEVPLEYHFSGKPLRHGHRVVKRSLVDRSRCSFPEVGDLHIPGITEVEGHYQPTANGEIRRLTQPLVHDDPDPIGTWVERHNRYALWEAHLRVNRELRRTVRDRRSSNGRIFERVPFKPLVFFVYSYILRAGFLDGRAGFDYAYALSFYYWLVDAKHRELMRENAVESARRDPAAGMSRDGHAETPWP